MTVGGLKAHYLRQGRGSPVMLIHGLGASSWSWRRVLPVLAERHDVCAVDLPGFGRSDKPRDFDYSFQGFGRWVLELMDKLGWEKAAFAGNSMGGGTSLRVTLEQPGRVTRLALLGSPVYPGDRPPLLWPMRWPVIGRIYESLLGEWVVRPLARSCFVDQSVVTEELVREYSRPLKEAGGRRAVAQFLRHAIPPDVDDWIARYPTMSVPVLAIRGSHDRVVDRASVDRFVSEWPAARALHIESCGHAPQEERPEVVGPALLEFFGGS